MKNINKIYGIDTLYYFCETNENYGKLYEYIEEEIKRQEDAYDKLGIQFDDRMITININGKEFTRLKNKAIGFHWFRESNSFYRIGFKDPSKNLNVHNIFVQLQVVGIYTLSIKKVVDEINQNLLKEYVTGHFPVNRVDVNCFVQYDFSFLQKNMFVTRKKHFQTISDIGNANVNDTINIGVPPYKFRIYNKTKELKKKTKKVLMEEYFKKHGFNVDETIFNIEFELRREILKTFSIGKDTNNKPMTINTIEDVFKYSEQLFKKCMDDIRLIDLNTLSKKAIENNNKRRAKNLPIWDEIKNNTSFKEFYQSTIPIEKLKPKEIEYSDIKFKKDFIAIIRKGNENRLDVGFEKLKEFIHEAIYGEEKVEIEFKNRFIPVEVQNEKGEVTEKLRLLENGTLFEPIVAPFKPTKDLSNFELKSLIQLLQSKDSLDSIDEGKLYVSIKEAKARGLVFDSFLKNTVERREDSLMLSSISSSEITSQGDKNLPSPLNSKRNNHEV